MAEPHLKTAGVAQYIRHQDDVPANAISPTAEVVSEFKLLKMRRKYRFLLFRIEGAQIVVDASAPPSAAFADLLRALPDSDCRYAVYDHEFTTADGRKSSKLFFVTWIPQNSHPGFKMAYTHAKPAIRAVCEGAFDVNAVTKKEVELGVGVSSGDASDSDSDFDD
jgi:cofilin